MRLIFMGTPRFAVPVLEYLLYTRHTVAAVYTQPDKPAGRGRGPDLSPVKRAALEHGLDLLQPPTLKKEDAVAQLARLKPDMVVVAAYGQILPRAVLELPPLGCLNVHPSLLPRFRGASPIPSAILAGDDFTGASIILMDEGLDTGPVLSRAAISISGGDTTGSLGEKLSLLGARLLGEVMVHWARREIAPCPQDNSRATYAPTIGKSAGRIDWHLPAVDLWRQVRAFNPWPGSFTTWQGRQLKVLKALPLAGSAPAGQVIASGRADTPFAVGTGSGVLGVAEVQLEGKRAMSAVEFLRGQRGLLGAALGG